MFKDQTFIAFVDCRVVGGWESLTPRPGLAVIVKKATNDENCFIDVMQIDTVRKYLHFKKDSIINVLGNVLFYSDGSTVEEITINEFNKIK